MLIRRSRTLALAVGSVAGLLALAACGSDGDGTATACSAEAAALEVPHVIPTQPASGAVVDSTFTVSGCSRTFESTVQWTLNGPSGLELARGVAMGGGVDGSAPFEFSVTAEVSGPTLAELRVFEEDA